MSSKNRIIDNDLGWRRLMSLGEALKGGSFVKVGILADSAKGGLHVPGAALTVAEIAAVQEYGTQDGRIPSRPFMRTTFDKQVDEMARLAKAAVLKILAGDMTVGQALGLMGAKFAAEIKKTITAGPEVPPTNAPSTKAAKEAKRAKGNTADVRTLVDTGRMVGAVTWEVVLGTLARSLGAKSAGK